MSAGAMKTQLHRFYLWLFPDRFKETATCKYCGVEGGLVCNEDELTIFWNWNQT